MTPEKETKVVADVASVARALVDLTPAGGRLNQFGKALLLLVQASENPASLAQAVEELDAVVNGSSAATEVEKLLRDLGIRGN